MRRITPSGCAGASPRGLSLSGFRYSGGTPALFVVPPGGPPDFGHAMVHTDAPFGQVEVAVMPPAQEDTIVGMGGAAVGVLLDVMYFAPGGGHGASGNDASSVAEGDGAALEGVEDACGGSDCTDAAVAVEEDALD